MPASYPLTSWAHRTRAMCRGTLELVESDFSMPAYRPMHAYCLNLPLSWIGDIDDFLPGKISVLKYTEIMKTSSAQKPGTCGNESVFFLLSKRCAVNSRTRRNATQQIFEQFH